jgi:hypothetical protein
MSHVQVQKQNKILKIVVDDHAKGFYWSFLSVPVLTNIKRLSRAGKPFGNSAY